MIDCDKYRARYKEIKDLIAKEDEDKRMKYLGSVAVATSVPILVVACYYGELHGFKPEVTDFIIRLKKFYNIKKVLNAIGLEGHTI